MLIQEITRNQVDPDRIRALLQEMVRSTVQRINEDLISPEPAHPEIDRLASIQADLEELKLVLRQRTWSTAIDAAHEAAQVLGLDPSDLKTPALARQILVTRRRLLELEAQVEQDLDDPLQVGRELLKEHGLQPSLEGLRPPMRLSEAIEKAKNDAPDEVAKKIGSVGKLALDFFGDVSMTELTHQRTVEFLEFVWWMPKNWGKVHGKNRFNGIDRSPPPSEERRGADAADKKLVAVVLADQSLTQPDRRQKLVAGLTPRLTESYTIVLRDMFRRIIVAALGNQRVGRDIDEDDRIIPSHRQLKGLMAKWKRMARTECGLPTRISKPKVRRSWSLERIARLLTSPIYQGSTGRQRSRRATSDKGVLIRDALYWVPLMMLHMGAGPEEILQLALSNVILRNRVFCIVIEGNLKNEQSQRILPIPQILLDLGFIEWVRQRRRAGQVWLFPEIPEDKMHGKKSQIFGDRLRTVLKTLDIASEHEDIYALRRTLSSRLLHAGVDTGIRQRILGHLEGTTVDAHYSDDGLADLKAHLDLVDYGIEIAKRSALGCPIISGCRISLLPQVFVDVDLETNGAIAAIGVYDAATEEALMEVRIEGTKLPASKPRSSAKRLDKEQAADCLLEISTSYEILMPGSEEATQALEHLLIFAEPSRSQ